MNWKHLLWIVPLVLASLFLALGFYAISNPYNGCVEISKPLCLPFPDHDVEYVASSILEDMNEMMPDRNFSVWTRLGCVHICEYTGGD